MEASGGEPPPSLTLAALHSLELGSRVWEGDQDSGTDASLYPKEVREVRKGTGSLSKSHSPLNHCGDLMRPSLVQNMNFEVVFVRIPTDLMQDFECVTIIGPTGVAFAWEKVTST